MHKTQKRMTKKCDTLKFELFEFFKKKFHRWPPVELRFETYERLPPVIHRWVAVGFQYGYELET